MIGGIIGWISVFTVVIAVAFSWYMQKPLKEIISKSAKEDQIKLTVLNENLPVCLSVSLSFCLLVSLSLCQAIRLYVISIHKKTSTSKIVLQLKPVFVLHLKIDFSDT